jgi:D-alanyl-D-alanine carboxypeptidase
MRWKMMKYRRLTGVFIVLAVCVFALKMRHQIGDTVASLAREDGWARVPDIEKKTLIGQFDPTSSRDFVQAQTPYANRAGLYLLGDVYDAFIEMHRAARVDGVSLVIVSATRNFDDQKRIWEGKWTGQRLVDSRNLAQTIFDPSERARTILRYSSMPGTSRHHWGTDIDINSVDTAYFESGAGLRTYQWLEAHAGQFGFIQAYTPKGKDRPLGYEEEPWHWSFHPIARFYTRQYPEKVRYPDITGFLGSDTASHLDVIKDYVLGINQDCLE